MQKNTASAQVVTAAPPALSSLGGGGSLVSRREREEDLIMSDGGQPKALPGVGIATPKTTDLAESPIASDSGTGLLSSSVSNASRSSVSSAASPSIVEFLHQRVASLERLLLLACENIQCSSQLLTPNVSNLGEQGEEERPGDGAAVLDRIRRSLSRRQIMGGSAAPFEMSQELKQFMHSAFDPSHCFKKVEKPPGDVDSASRPSPVAAAHSVIVLDVSSMFSCQPKLQKQTPPHAGSADPAAAMQCGTLGAGVAASTSSEARCREIQDCAETKANCCSVEGKLSTSPKEAKEDKEDKVEETATTLSEVSPPALLGEMSSSTAPRVRHIETQTEAQLHSLDAAVRPAPLSVSHLISRDTSSRPESAVRETSPDRGRATTPTAATSLSSPSMIKNVEQLREEIHRAQRCAADQRRKMELLEKENSLLRYREEKRLKDQKASMRSALTSSSLAPLSAAASASSGKPLEQEDHSLPPPSRPLLQATEQWKTIESELSADDAYFDKEEELRRLRILMRFSELKKDSDQLEAAKEQMDTLLEDHKNVRRELSKTLVKLEETKHCLQDVAGTLFSLLPADSPQDESLLLRVRQQCSDVGVNVSVSVQKQQKRKCPTEEQKPPKAKRPGCGKYPMGFGPNYLDSPGEDAYGGDRSDSTRSGTSNRRRRAARRDKQAAEFDVLLSSTSMQREESFAGSTTRPRDCLQIEKQNCRLQKAMSDARALAAALSRSSGVYEGYQSSSLGAAGDDFERQTKQRSRMSSSGSNFYRRDSLNEGPSRSRSLLKNDGKRLRPSSAMMS